MEPTPVITARSLIDTDSRLPQPPLTELMEQVRFMQGQVGKFVCHVEVVVGIYTKDRSNANYNSLEHAVRLYDGAAGEVEALRKQCKKKGEFQARYDQDKSMATRNELLDAMIEEHVKAEAARTLKRQKA